MLDVIDANDSAHFNLSYFRTYGIQIPENRYKYTLNSKNQVLSDDWVRSGALGHVEGVIRPGPSIVCDRLDPVFYDKRAIPSDFCTGINQNIYIQSQYQVVFVKYNLIRDK